MGKSFKVGEAPWEQTGGPKSFKVGEAPWEQSGSGGIIEETHPDLSWADRAIFKNFSNDPESGVKFLQKENPNLQFKRKDNRVLVKSPGAGAWNVLDPEGFDMADITDVGYDVVGGIGEGVAAGAAGLAAGAASGGLAAIPAAMGAGATAGAGVETARQGIGQMFGVNEEFKGGDVGTAAAFGAAAPLLLGTGAAGKAVAKKALASGMEEAALKSTQRGVLGAGYDKTVGFFGPKLGALASGEAEGAIKKAAGSLDSLKQADVDPNVRTSALNDTAKNVVKGLKAETKNIGDQLNDLRSLIDNEVPEAVEGVISVGGKSKGTIPTESFMAPFAELEQYAMENMTGTAAEQADLKKLAKILRDEFFVDGAIPAFMTAAQVDAKRKRFKALAQQYGLKFKQSGATTSAMDGASPMDARFAQAFEDSREAMNDAIIDRLEKMSGGEGQKYADLQAYYGQVKKLQADNKNKFKNARSLSQTFGRAIRDDVEAANLQQIQEITGLDLKEAALNDEALKIFSNPSGDIRSVGGTTSTSRAVPLAAAGGLAGAAAAKGGGDRFTMTMLGSLIGAKAASPAAMRKQMEMNKYLRQGMPFGQTPQIPIPFTNKSIPSMMAPTPMAPGIQPHIWQNMLQSQQEGY